MTRRDRHGSLSYEDVVQFLATQDWPVTSVQVADEFGISQQAAYYRLDKLQERGDVERRKYNQTVLWRLRGS